jgi:hypothetical protein
VKAFTPRGCSGRSMETGVWQDATQREMECPGVKELE